MSVSSSSPSYICKYPPPHPHIYVYSDVSSSLAGKPVAIQMPGAKRKKIEPAAGPGVIANSSSWGKEKEGGEEEKEGGEHLYDEGLGF